MADLMSRTEVTDWLASGDATHWQSKKFSFNEVDEDECDRPFEYYPEPNHHFTKENIEAYGIMVLASWYVSGLPLWLKDGKSFTEIWN
jgi:hypothetical protein